MSFLAIGFVVPLTMRDSKVAFLVTGMRFSGAGARNVVKLDGEVTLGLDKFERVTVGRIYEEMEGATVMGEGLKAKKTVKATKVMTKA